MHSPVHANFGLAESTENVNQMVIDASNPFRGKGLFSYTNFQTENAEKCIEEALDSLNIRRESRKIILKEKQERAVRGDFGE